MKSLYFNTKLIGSQLHKNFNNFSFYPMMYPRKDKGLSQFEVLIGVIESFKLLTFNYAIFNIEIDNITKENEKTLLDAISNNINSIKKTYVNLSRPSDKTSWCQDISHYIKETRDKSPFLVIMNHDHPYVDYSEKVLDLALSNVFKNFDENYKKVMHYSHAPEFISKSINENGVSKYSTPIGSLYQHQKVSDWLDSLSFMTLETLLHIFSSVKITKDPYLGRFDWPGVYYKDLDITGYSYCREFFRHYDGYYHVTGMRLDTKLVHTPFGYSFPGNGSLNEISNFYYLRWVDCYFLTIRDYLRKNFLYSKKKSFMKIMGITIEEFLFSYIDQDKNNNLISENNVDEIKLLTIDKIYHNANKIYCEIKIDNELFYIPLWKKIAKLAPYRYRVKIKIFIQRFS